MCMTSCLHVNHVNNYNFFIIDIQKPMAAVKLSRWLAVFLSALCQKALSSAHTPAGNMIENPESIFLLGCSTCPQYLCF